MAGGAHQGLTFALLTTASMVGWAGAASAQTPTSDGPRLSIQQATVEFVRKQATVDAAISKQSTSSSDAAWAKLRALSPGAKVQVEAVNATEVKGRLRSVQDDAITVQTDSGDWRVLREDVWRVRVPDVGKRVLVGMIGTIAGIMAPTLICPSCENEGHSTKNGRLLLGGAGSLLFLAPQTATIYKATAKR